MGLFSVFTKGASKKAQEAADKMKKMENRDLLQATVAGCLLIAAANDGKIEPSEVADLERLIQASPAMSHFGAEIPATIGRVLQQFEASFAYGKMQALRELADVKASEDEKTEVIVCIISIAGRDGIDEKELAVIDEIARSLGVQYKQFLG